MYNVIKFAPQCFEEAKEYASLFLSKNLISKKQCLAIYNSMDEMKVSHTSVGQLAAGYSWGPSKHQEITDNTT